MPLTVIFVRHGESHANVDRVFANRPDHPAGLTPAGVAQAGRLARTLASEGITHIFSSPVLRARQTAEVLADALGVAIEVSDALREYDVGDFEGLPYGGEHAWRWAAYERVDRAWARGDRLARLAGGESLAEIEARFLPFMEALAQRHAPSDRLLLVGHGGLYRTAFPALFPDLTAGDTRRLPLDHGTAIVAVRDGGEWRCRSWGDEWPARLWP